MTRDEELSAICSRIEGLRESAVQAADARQATLTKPAGSLGRLEKVAAQLAGIYGDLEHRVERRAVFVFVADHGVAEAGVSAFPAEVTRQMLLNFATGGAAVNVLARQAGAEVFVCDVGVKDEPIDDPRIVSARVRPGTANMLDEPAMDRDEALAAIFAGIQLFRREHDEAPFDLVASGEMGIGNTTAASALVTGTLQGEASEATGRGTGIDDAGHARKIDAVRHAVRRHRPSLEDPVGALAGVGGLEIGALTGLFIAAAEARVSGSDRRFHRRSRRTLGARVGAPGGRVHGRVASFGRTRSRHSARSSAAGSTTGSRIAIGRGEWRSAGNAHRGSRLAAFSRDGHLRPSRRCGPRLMPVGLRVALQLLTVFPAGRTEDLEKGALRAGWWFAPVSLLIGGGAALVWLASSLVLPYAVPEFLAVAALLILSGGLHFDGLLDATDALAASATSERRLEIMKDVRVGAFGVAAAVLVLLGKFVGLAAIAPSYRWQTIVVAVLSGAVTMVLLLRFFPYARGGRRAGSRIQGRSLMVDGAVGAPVVRRWIISAVAPGGVGGDCRRNRGGTVARISCPGTAWRADGRRLWPPPRSLGKWRHLS